jgi:hypothetical protein
MIGDAPGIYVADVKMIDVVSGQVSDESAYGNNNKIVDLFS